jgi:hypothetical protein
VLSVDFDNVIHHVPQSVVYRRAEARLRPVGYRIGYYIGYHMPDRQELVTSVGINRLTDCPPDGTVRICA